MATPASEFEPDDHGTLRARYETVRARTEALAAPLSAEDACVQSMADTSPAKWHLAHVSWFFETFVLEAHERPFVPHQAAYRELYNSYYNGIGAQFPRPDRGLITRPSLAEVLEYRRAVDARMLPVIATADGATSRTIELGLHHEQQHQELLLMDVKHLLSQNPLMPAYATAPAAPQPRPRPRPPAWHEHAGGLLEFGADPARFCFDNETPRHRVHLAPFRLGSGLISNAEYLAFMRDGGYTQALLWLADGWHVRTREDWHAPLYWREIEGQWHEYTLYGLRPLDPAAPVCHVSHYEADAFAQWAGARLPTEFEWEAVACSHGASVPSGAGALQPQAPCTVAPFGDLFGAVWQWTRSAYLPYPGFRAAAGAVGEYNGKFMSNQMSLRGSACITPPGHARVSYRNFFYPHQRWAFTGIRLAADS